jgi:hypothetical protein
VRNRNLVPPGRVPPRPKITRGDDEVEPPPGDSPNATPSRWLGNRAAGGTRLPRPATGMQIRNANTPAQMRLALTKRLRRKTNQRVRPLSFRFHRLPRFGLWAQAAACLARAALVASRTVPCHPDGRRRCDCNCRRAPRICARLHNLTPSCARTCCHCTQPCAVCHVVVSLIVTRHHPTITTLVVLGARLRPAPLGSGRIGGLGQAGRAPLVPVATCPKIQLPNLQGLGGPPGLSLVTQNKQSLLTGREVRDAK